MRYVLYANLQFRAIKSRNPQDPREYGRVKLAQFVRGDVGSMLILLPLSNTFLLDSLFPFSFLICMQWDRPYSSYPVGLS